MSAGDRSIPQGILERRRRHAAMVSGLVPCGRRDGPLRQTPRSVLGGCGVSENRVAGRRRRAEPGAAGGRAGRRWAPPSGQDGRSRGEAIMHRAFDHGWLPWETIGGSVDAPIASGLAAVSRRAPTHAPRVHSPRDQPGGARPRRLPRSRGSAAWEPAAPPSRRMLERRSRRSPASFLLNPRPALAIGVYFTACHCTNSSSRAWS
jgi:hypothetical protein